MKLEEVLPLMREGRVAVDKDGKRWWCEGPTKTIGQQTTTKSWVAMSPPLDGWSLEPERVRIPIKAEAWVEEQWDALVRIARAGQQARRGANVSADLAELFEALDAIELEP